MIRFIVNPIFIFFLITLLYSCNPEDKALITIKKENKISIIGGNLCSRMMEYDYFETEIHSRYPDSMFTVRNMCDPGDTPAFRPHPARPHPWAFPGAEQLFSELRNNSDSQGHFESPDEWLTRLKTDVIIAFFGYNESFEGPSDLPRYKQEVEAFINHTLKQKYNGQSPPKLVMVSPIAFEDLSKELDVPDGKKENVNLKAYAEAIKELSFKHKLGYIDVYNPSLKWYNKYENLTIDGSQLNAKGYEVFSKYLCDVLFGKKEVDKQLKASVYQAVEEKNFFWKNEFKMPNGVHVYGRRYQPFGQDNYPSEIIKTRELTAIRDTLIWKTAQNKKYDVTLSDGKTTVLPAIETNYSLADGKAPIYLYGEDALKTIKTAEGYKVELFASEKEFPDLANPVQISFDNKGRLWVATMPSYPHYKIGDARPNDKLIILEDTNNDGKADKQTTFADKLHLPIGFELAKEGVYISQGNHLKLYTDTNNDDKADRVAVLLSGFDDHDTHHAISAFCADESGAIFMGEGTFLHSNVETSYGTVRATNGGFMRYNPTKHHLERTQLSIPNPWGIAFDDWGQNIFIETSGPDLRWMMPGGIKPVYGKAAPASPSLIEEDYKVRPTAGLEFISSRHFPDNVQGDFLLNNTIGFLGTRQHSINDKGTGFESCFRQDLLTSSDGNFRPVDLEFAPDGSLYIADWHNVLIGHMQHNARDPLRDHVHGRIYRITYPTRPLVKPAKIYGASIFELLDNLKLPEYRTRYRCKRELRGRDKREVKNELSKWIKELDKNDNEYEHHLLEALWVSWGMNEVDEKILNQLLNAKDYRARAAAVRVLRYNGDKIKNQKELLLEASGDIHGRVRLEALVAASWLNKEDAMPILNVIKQKPLDEWMIDTYKAIVENFESRIKVDKPRTWPDNLPKHFTQNEKELFLLGEELYHKEGNCTTCHQPDGRGLESSGFPSIANNEWILGDEEKVIKITLNGLIGPISVNGKKYDGKTPMIPYGGLLNDKEIAAILTYVRNSFGNKTNSVSEDKVKEVRIKTKDKKGFYKAAEL